MTCDLEAILKQFKVETVRFALHLQVCEKPKAKNFVLDNPALATAISQWFHFELLEVFSMSDSDRPPSVLPKFRRPNYKSSS